MKKIKSVEKLTNNKWLNLYQVNYQLDDNKQLSYYFASRRKESDVALMCDDKIDAVRILPYYKKDGKIYVVLIKEFRYPINSYIYSTPAGLVDDGELPEEAAKREVSEEIGASVLNINLVQKGAYSSAGLTDEKIAVYEAEVVLDKSQNLGDGEDISFLCLPLENILDFVDNNNFGMQSALHLKMFYYKHIKN